MKRFSIILFASFMIALSGCYKTVEKMGNTTNEVVLAYPAVNQYNIASSGLNYWSKSLINPDLGKDSDTLVFSLNIRHAVSQTITVNIDVDKAAVDAYNNNAIYGATYEMMPDSYFSIVAPSVTLPAGTTDTTFKVALHPSIFDISQTGYMLPITITSATGLAVSKMNTAYIHIEKDPYPPYSRAGWSVAGFDSQEEVGEGPDNGRVEFLYDNNNGTFWHTQWQGGQPPLPHWFAIDMGGAYELNGIMFLDRQGVGSPGRPKDVVVEVGNDNVNWTVVQSFTMADDNAKWQKYTFPSPTAAVRYFKVTVKSTYGDTYYTNLAEVKVY